MSSFKGEILKIGIFDSGIGGLSVLREVAAIMDRCDIYYFADRLNAPYGNKSKEEVFAFCAKIVEEFIALEISTILIACNSATAMAINELRDQYPQIRFFGIEPFINIINLRPELKQKSGLVLTTLLTSSSPRFENLKRRYDPAGILNYRYSRNLAALIEKSFDTGRLDEDSIAKEIHESIDGVTKIDYVILGCTHYPFVSDIFKRELKIECISPCAHVAGHMSKECGHICEGEIRESFFYKERSVEASKEEWRTVKKQNLCGFPFF